MAGLRQVCTAKGDSTYSPSASSNRWGVSILTTEKGENHWGAPRLSWDEKRRRKQGMKLIIISRTEAVINGRKKVPSKKQPGKEKGRGCQEDGMSHRGIR